MKYKHIFEPYKLRGVTLKNRLISAPCERNYANTDGSVTQKYIDYVVERAKGGVGLINVESIYIDPVGRGHIRQLGIYDDNEIILKGIPACTGTAIGTIKVVEGIKDISKFNDGDILVAKVTEPSMVIMMNKASAIITDTGGITSHAAIVSRELGVPCIVNTKTATLTLKDGMRVKVDGGKGEIYEIN